LNLTSVTHGIHPEIYESMIYRVYTELAAHESIGSAQKPINCIIFDIRKYYDWAINYEKAIILATEDKPYPYFQIKLSDLSTELKKALDELLDARGLELVLKQAVLRIYHDIQNAYNEVFPEADARSKQFIINLHKKMATTLKVKFVS